MADAAFDRDTVKSSTTRDQEALFPTVRQFMAILTLILGDRTDRKRHQ
jgi:hypothetical protein